MENVVYRNNPNNPEQFYFVIRVTCKHQQATDLHSTINTSHVLVSSVVVFNTISNFPAAHTKWHPLPNSRKWTNVTRRCLRYQRRPGWARDYQYLWYITVIIGSVPPSLTTSLKLLGVYSKHLVSQMQKSVLLSSTHI